MSAVKHQRTDSKNSFNVVFAHTHTHTHQDHERKVFSGRQLDDPYGQ